MDTSPLVPIRNYISCPLCAKWIGLVCEIVKPCVGSLDFGVWIVVENFGGIRACQVK